MRPADPRLLRHARAARGYLIFTVGLGLVVTALVLAQAGLLAHALATVLFLVGISGHFKVRGARIGLISIAGVILVFSVAELIIAPKPPV